ncbi:hypothetical protein [Streptomyces halobius]|uniref:SUKH-4 immunity protein of toxin-antitoxin system n=1 Tax=Streptomyces halobius TaxID=2879846 RepID=A0ABY4M720_9ACTN|nr:hypothetical protein [Streptomyces halobius]UQA92191.1 hypothetical protein K9S39_10400 [Streptomyces halobius]
MNDDTLSDANPLSDTDSLTLPEPYRTPVAEIADGCAGGPPDYELVPLAALPDDRSDGAAERALDAPFALTEAWLWDEWDDDPRPSEEIEPLLAPVSDHDSVVLGTDGCGMYWLLIVTGEHAAIYGRSPAMARPRSERRSAIRRRSRRSRVGAPLGAGKDWCDVCDVA